ncbi:2-amino-4-hydroxy-6-hydroxymethyldihydropteridine diphosphokinase [Pseudoalteromonas sp. GCY]|uniref:2-amino-4-hydroxy-6- hydroxymethyldihydropteridine diphosphokinase n=1 Tax=Pseudoalteromonas sp. GCY TaxID=2003316 RepID=UPI000BFF050F|nr:2-amino-4-hydroxy-6-hydroxymethyldihydropteridine diphosphokinase [Pseudoalteromonas sp. GCY]PHI35140.1 2-amino-4-hydroxy-6-hydroxymethyldihydropteridine diphosphokinase [Pseudoalteromonas sp. GCY]QQQ66668.1 2-amino-4-hydroxy-6-hydroxymethyldihydropteridine diphosphokinase [Pseudoalteromonas sp. GCY]
MNIAYIGLGANLSEPMAQIQRALDVLAAHPDLSLVQHSSLYGSKPMGPQDQPDYVNAVAKLATSLTAESLLDVLQQIELEHGRVRKAERWGPRTLDLDILLFNTDTISSDRLTVPHYGLKEREFVVYPLLEIAPELKLPDGTELNSLTQKLPLNGLAILK